MFAKKKTCYAYSLILATEISILIVAGGVRERHCSSVVYMQAMTTDIFGDVVRYRDFPLTHTDAK